MGGSGYRAALREYWEWEVAKERPGAVLTRILSMMAFVPRILYFLEGLEAACLMAHVVLPAAGRPTIIRIYKKGTGRGTEAAAGCGTAA